MSDLLVVGADEVIEQLVVQCWIFQARSGDRATARSRAERTLERLLSRGLPSGRGPGGVLRLDPYAAANAIKSRVGDPADEAWPDWQETTRRNAVSLPAGAHRYRFTLLREWHHFAASPGRPLVFRLPLPLREPAAAPPALRLLEPAGGLVDRRDQPGRVELRVDPSAVHGPVVAELVMEFTGREVRDEPEAPAALLGGLVEPGAEPWLRPREGLIAPSQAVADLAARLAEGQKTTRDLVHAIWPWLISTLRFGDVHRGDLDAQDPLGGLLRTRLADCVLGSSLLVALCRARGVPARLISGFLLHPANLGPHTWAEVMLAPGRWVPYDFGSWCYCAGDPVDPIWGQFYLGRVDARLVAEVAPREFTGWGSATPPDRWFRLERLVGERIEHTLHSASDGALIRRDQLALELLGADRS